MNNAVTLDPGGLSERALWTWLGAGIVVALIACYRIAAELLLLGSAEGGWTFTYARHFSPSTLGLALAAIAVAAVPLWLSESSARPRDGRLIVAYMTAGLAVQAIIQVARPFGLAEIFASDIANGFYTVVRQYSAASVLGRFDQLRMDWPLHAQGNMPGKVLLLFLFKHISRRADVMAWLTVVVSNVGAWVMYGFVRELFASRRVALNAAILYLIVPAKLYFFPLLNAVTPVIVLTCAWLLVVWLRTARAWYAAALGIALYGVVFFEPLPLVMGLLFALLVARALWRHAITWAQLIVHGSVGGAAWIVTYAIVRVATGFDLIQAFRDISAHAWQFNVTANRGYAIWVRENLREFLFGVGVCQAVVFMAAAVDASLRRPTWRERLTHPAVILSAGIAAVLLVIDLIGANRGEVIRLWIFLACFFQIPVAYVCARLHSGAALALVVSVTLLQATLGTGMIGFVGP